MEQMTFQELIDDIGSTALYYGTEATSDSATQKIIQDFFWDSKLCSEKNKFVKYFQNRINNIYPLYLEEVRALTVKENMDPFVTDYFQHVTDDITHENGTSNKTSGSNGSNSTVYQKGTSSETVRTPDLTTSSENSSSTNGSSTENKSGSDMIQRTGSDSTNNTETSNGTNTDNKLSNTYTHSEDTNETKSDNISINYPEANLNGLGGLDIDDIPGNRSIDYASSEAIGLIKGTSNGNSNLNATEVDTQNTQNTSTGNSTTQHNTKDTTTYGGETNIENQSESEDNGTVRQTGNETTTTTNSGYDTTTFNNNDSSNEDSTDERNIEYSHKEEHKGRHESVADLIPKVISSIRNSNTVLWFVDYMKVCFDCTEY